MKLKLLKGVLVTFFSLVKCFPDTLYIQRVYEMSVCDEN